MYKMFTKAVIINLLVICVYQVISLDWTVTTPTFHCDRKKLLENKPTAIKITGKDFTNATFAVTIAFQPNQTCAKSQRCVLMMWRNMRDVRSALVVTNTTNSYTIEFPNHMLAATTQYIVNITAKVHQIPVDFKKETLICSNNTKLEKVTNKAHLILMGSTVSYCDSDYILNADVNYVESDYHYKWEILDNSGNLLKIDPSKGSVLRVRANSLAANTDYIVRCTAIETENGTVIDLKTKNLRILNKDLILSLAVRNISVGVNKPFTLSAYFQDDDQEETETIWTCVDQEEHPCKDFTFENSTTLSGTKLSRVGRYHITIIVKKNRIHVTDSCEVYVIANGYAQIDISSVIVPTDPSNEIVVSTYITALVTGCTLRWIPLNKTAGYIPGISGVVTNITAAEDKFLNELEESTGTTVDKEYNLVIPKPNEKWSGLKGNTCYSFRLNVTCPIQTVTKKSSEQEELIDVKYLSLTADVLIQTHKLPELNALQVSPLKGSALTTEFTFYTNATAESELTLYKFGYLLKGRVIYIANIQGDYERQSILPYIVNGVPTILQGCNRYYLCSSAAGPIVHTTFSEPTEEENRNITAKLAELMKRQDYYKAFSLAIAILETYKYAKPETFDNVKNFVGNLTTSETRRLSNLDMGDATHSIVAKEYIVEVTTLLDTKLIYDDHLLDTLLELKNKVISKKREDVEEVEVKSTIRKLLQVAQTPVRQSAKMSLEEVKSYLVISELIITSSNSTKRVNQEKQNMINQIDKYMVPLCSSLHDKQQTMVLDLKTVSLSLEKINNKTLNRNYPLVHDKSIWKQNGKIKIGKCFLDNLAFPNQLCLGRAVFKNYFNKNDYAFMVKVFGTTTNDQIKIQKQICDIALMLPTDPNQHIEKEAKCSLWKENWQQSECKTVQEFVNKAVQCQCKNLGYYSLRWNMTESEQQPQLPSQLE